MGRVIMSGIVPLLSKPYVGPKASLTPTSGITYTEGLAGVEPVEISSYAQAISNVTGVTNDTTAMYIDYGDVHRKIGIGNQVTIGVNNVNYAFDVIGFNHDDLTDSMAYGKATVSGKAGMTLQMHDLFSSTLSMNSQNTNVGGWKSCNMRTTTMVNFLSQLASSWQDIVKQTNKLTSAGNKSTTIETTADNLFLLSEIEVKGAITYSFTGEGTQYAYYKTGNSAQKWYHSNVDSWRERSPMATDVTRFCVIGSIGDAGYDNGASNYIRVSLAFCI